MAQTADQGFTSGPAFSPQEYQTLFLEIGGTLMTEVQKITIVRTDGGADVMTLARDYAGRVKGAAKADITFNGVVPYKPSDVGGYGFDNQGMMAGPPSGGPANAYQPGQTPLDQTMLTSLNSYNNQPVQFAILIGPDTSAGYLVFKGFIHEITVDAAVGKPTDFSCKASGQFSNWT